MNPDQLIPAEQVESESAHVVAETGRVSVVLIEHNAGDDRKREAALPMDHPQSTMEATNTNQPPTQTIDLIDYASPVDLPDFSQPPLTLVRIATPDIAATVVTSHQPSRLRGAAARANRIEAQLRQAA